MTAHITGYVSPANKRDVKANPELRYLPASRIGRSGLERTFETNLRGAAGVERIEMNAKGKPVRVLRDKQATAGDDVRLSVDVGAQSYAAEVAARKVRNCAASESGMYKWPCWIILNYGHM